MASDRVGGGLGRSSMEFGQFLSHSDLPCLSQQGQAFDQCQMRPQNNGTGAIRAPKLSNTNRKQRVKPSKQVLFVLRLSDCLLS